VRGIARALQLTDAQVEEVRRRMADPNRVLVSHAEARERIRWLGSSKRADGMQKMNFKRKRRKSARAGCLLCKP
jgi:hypothetical protein